MATEPLTSRPAGFWLRVGAKFCDWTLLFAVQFAVLSILAGLDAVMGWQPVSLTMGIFGVFAVIQIVYFGVGNAKGRRTVGYRLAGLQLQNLHGGPLATGRSLWRALLSTIALSLQIYGGFLDFVPAMFGPKKRAGHDFATTSQVVCTHGPRLLALWGLPVLLLIFLTSWAADVISPSPLQVYFIPAKSMEPTLAVDDRIMVNRLAYRSRAPRNGDIAVFAAPRLPQLGLNGDVDFVKRVIGTPGQVVVMVKGELRVNGSAVSEPYVSWKNEPAELLPGESELRYDMKIVDGAIYSREYFGADEPGPWTQYGAIIDARRERQVSASPPGKVPSDQFLMLGDHRSNSNDSHVWGFAPRGSFQGRAMNVFWPLSRWKTFR